MDWPDAILFMACAFAAEVIGTMAGFGAATIITPIAVLFMDMRTAIAVVACFHLFGNASRLFFFRRHVAWPFCFQFGLAAVVCGVVGANLTTQMSSSLIKLVFGAFLLLYVAITQLAADRVHLPKGRSMLLGGGAASGFIAGLIGTGGAIRSACLLAFGLPKEVYLGTSAAIALAVDATRVPIYLTGQLLPQSMVPMVVGLIGVAFAGAWLGRRLVHRVSAVGFRRFVMVMLAVMGLKLFLDGWHGLA